MAKIHIVVALWLFPMQLSIRFTSSSSLDHLPQTFTQLSLCHILHIFENFVWTEIFSGNYLKRKNSCEGTGRQETAPTKRTVDEIRNESFLLKNASSGITGRAHVNQLPYLKTFAFQNVVLPFSHNCFISVQYVWLKIPEFQLHKPPKNSTTSPDNWQVNRAVYFLGHRDWILFWIWQEENFWNTPGSQGLPWSALFLHLSEVWFIYFFSTVHIGSLQT